MIGGEHLLIQTYQPEQRFAGYLYQFIKHAKI